MDEIDGNCVGKVDESGEHDAITNLRTVHETVTAKMPTEKNATHYNMNHKNRGLALVFNHEVFEMHKERHGTSVDCKKLLSCLRKLDFDVQVYHNLKYADVQAKIVAAAKLDHSDNDCILITILTHGDDRILYAKDYSYPLDTIWTPFTVDKCPTLAGKPKLFFIQACRGDKVDPGVTLMKKTEFDGYPNTYKPSQADFLIAYSTVAGYYSWRCPNEGSWFIQALYTELNNNMYTYDLLTILTFVCRRVAVDYETWVPSDPSTHKQKQVPCITSMLIRLVKFTKKK